MIEINEIKNGKKIVNIGSENRVVSSRIVAIVNPNSAPVKRLINEAKENHLLIDATGGKTKRSVIMTDSRHVIISSISPRNLSARIEKNILD
ncbi:MAG: DUF370 domain-containing protein [Candidatus Aminicenantes bacterium]|jgi:regulator of extracellular matrix RemA (YlzA/DUF370 family)